MSVDVADLRAFYGSPLGALSSRMIARVLGALWPSLAGLGVLGIGFASPYLPTAAASSCDRVAAIMPAAQGAVCWPPGGPSATVLADPLMLPLPDGSADRILVVHALETAEDPAEFLHEVARLLAPSGRAIFVCPNRRGVWARLDTTPFGQGQPFSRSQLRRLMQKATLVPERWAEALHAPPFRSRAGLRFAGAWERVGEAMSLPFAGLHIVEVSRPLQRPVLLPERRRARQRRPVFVPVPAARDAGEGCGTTAV